jgi:hypothetical protein
MDIRDMYEELKWIEKCDVEEARYSIQEKYWDDAVLCLEAIIERATKIKKAIEEGY